MTMEMQNTAWENARQAAEWQQQTDQAVGDFYKFMSGYRPNQNPWFTSGGLGTIGDSGASGTSTGGTGG